MTKFPLELCEVFTVQTHRQRANLQEINKTLLLETLKADEYEQRLNRC